ncbi:PAS domain-containing protein [Desertivirga arenae]|uniref:PAS domain-containing protein n=1 Tax=Desertivirga arenae TaxID=2810309 RepID=UPI001A96CB4C|nr:PAS domain-containing protein [Pedobacter sp. SYSU D00823]
MSSNNIDFTHPEELLIFESLPGNFLLLSPDLEIIGASNNYLETTGKEREVITGKYLFDVFPISPEWLQGQDGGIRDSLEEVISSRKEHHIESMRFDVPSKDGQSTEERYWKTTNKPVLGKNGAIRYIIHHTEDITQEVLNERYLQEALKTERKATAKASMLSVQIERLFHDIPAQMAILSGDDLVYTYVNPQYQQELFPGREVLGLPLLAALPEIFGQAIWHILQKVYQTGEPHIEAEMMVHLAAHKGGAVEEHYFNTVYHPMRNERGEIDGLLSFKYEITQHVAARKKLEVSEARLLEAHLDLKESYEELQAIHEELQVSNEELKATNEELKTAQESLSSLNAELEGRIGERTKQLTDSLEEQQALNEELAATNEELNETQLVLKKILNGLRESEQRFRNLVRDIKVGIVLLMGEEMEVAIVNESYGRLIGRPVEELEGELLFDVIPEAEKDFRPIIDQVRLSGQPLYLNDHPYFVFKDGQTINGFLDLVYQPYLEPDGSVSGVMVVCQDVTEQVTARRKLIESEERFRFMLNAIPQQVWTASPEGALNYVNQVVTDDFGYNGEEIVGYGWQKFIHPEDLQSCLKAWNLALSGGKEYETEFRLLMKDGEYVWHIARALPFFQDGQIVQWLGTNTNIQLQKNNEQKKDEFMSIASHELKTPLTSIKAFNQIMQRMEAPERLKVFIGKSADHIYRLEKLINDLLDVTKISAGKMEYDMKLFDFTAMLTDAVESVQLKSEKHQILLRYSKRVNYTGDRLRLEQVINNFLSNAIKYSPDATEVIINCQVEENSIIVSIRDFGIGIDKAHLDKLFDRFYRVDNTAMRFEGLGLGLFISSEILKRHQGSFWIESELGQGTTFYFRLPLEEQKAEIVVANDDLYYHDSSITIMYNDEAKRLDVDWTGFQDFDSVQAGCLKILRILKHHKVSKVLNDNTHVMGTWSEAAEWVGKEWFPMMEEAGLCYFAWVYSPSAFSKLSADKSVEVKLDGVITRFFNDIHAANKWLNSIAEKF